MASQEPKLDRSGQTRALILQWLIWGEGSEATIQELANAGNDLARGALHLGRMQRREPSCAPPDALLAAAQIVSLRLGFGSHAQEDIALAFRKAAVEGGTAAVSSLPASLQPLAQAYAHPDVYESVQFAMHAEDGMGALLAALAPHASKAPHRSELAFWCDKTTWEHRLLLTHALGAALAKEAKSEPEDEVHAALVARAGDVSPLVRNAALRRLHAHAASQASEEIGASVQ